MNSDAEAFFKYLEEQGEAKVRADLAASVYGQKKHGLVHEWLRQKDQSRTDSSNREQIAIARDAAASARDAADAARDSVDVARDAMDEAKEANHIARKANKTAIIAIAVATISAIVSLLS